MRCPVCRAEVEQGPLCRRCRADLLSLFALEEQRRHVMMEAVRALAEGETRRAQALAEGTEALRADDESRRLRAVCHLLKREFRQALECYREAANGGDEHRRSPGL